MKTGLIIPLLLGLATLTSCATRQADVTPASPYRDPSTLAEGQILHLATGRLLTAEQLYTYLSHDRVVYVGETHDNLDAHAVQLAILTEMQRRFPGQLALGLEMLRRPYQQQLDAYLAGELSEQAFISVWEQSWGPDSYPYYRELLAFCREHGIPVLALNPGRDLEAAIFGGATPTDPDIAARLPELDLSDPYYRATMTAYFEAHAGGSEQGEIFLRVQALRDETMADTAAAFLVSPLGEDKRLLVFAGGNHVRYGFGVPRRLYRRLPLPYTVVDTFIVNYPEEKRDRLMDVTLPDLPLSPADFYWAVGYRDLADRDSEAVQAPE